MTPNPQQMCADLTAVYGPDVPQAIWPQLMTVLDKFRADHSTLHQPTQAAHDHQLRALILLHCRIPQWPEHKMGKAETQNR